MSEPSTNWRLAVDLAIQALDCGAIPEPEYASLRQCTLRALRQASAVPHQPVAILAVSNNAVQIGWLPGYIAQHNDLLYRTEPHPPLAHAPARLSGDDIDAAYRSVWSSGTAPAQRLMAFARAIETTILGRA